ncbi:hypothetical protein FB45DRAFT_1038041 [Roridomyces roridus]|uniref:Hydrophobin n=1 Tax=Roridomyces roridus TaxID=1738132 RepID=A0AAD7FBI5_9AGAR|nr:hypothetical protein FB45DRAFT_1038041 [Roridomyces roridus]
MQFKLTTITIAAAFSLISEAAAMFLERQTEAACHRNTGNACDPEIVRQCCAPLVCGPTGTVTGALVSESSRCCKGVVSSTSTAASVVAALLGLDLTGLNVPIGLTCSPLEVGNCGGTPVVCDEPEVEWGGLLAINCIPL